MIAPRFEIYFQQTASPELPDPAITQYRLLRPRIPLPTDLRPMALMGEPMNQLISGFRRTPLHQRMINFPAVALADILVQPRKRLAGSGKKNNSADAAIDPMNRIKKHRPGLAFLNPHPFAGPVFEITQSGSAVLRKHPRRLVHRQQMIIRQQNQRLQLLCPVSDLTHELACSKNGYRSRIQRAQFPFGSSITSGFPLRSISPHSR